MPFPRVAIAFGSLSLVLAFATPSFANGRFPAANQLVVHPGDPNTLIVRATFGLLVSHEQGKNPRLVCDVIIGAAAVVDPGVALFGDGTFLVAAPEGLAVSRDNACSFPFIGGELANQRFIDVSVDHTNPLRALALSATRRDDGTENVRVFETTNAGATWAAISSGLDPNVLVTTLDVAPSNGQRVYLSGNRVVSGKLEGFVGRSDDGGKTFVYATANYAKATQIYIAGVDPLDADLLYLRTYFTDAGPSSLVVSRDGGKTFEIALTIQSNMSGFALSPDGSRVAIAGLQTGVTVAARPLGPDAGPLSMTFEEHSPLPMRCLGWTGNKLFGCGSGVPLGCGNGDGQFLLGSSEDEGRTWNTVIPLMADIGAPNPDCADDTPSKKVCGPIYPTLQKLLTCPYVKLDAGTKDAAPEAGDAGTTKPPPDNCDCGVVGSPAPITPVGMFGLGVAGLGATGLGVRRIVRRKRARAARRSR
jgi:hypothetical protein